jgi:hypothetical protein
MRVVIETSKEGVCWRLKGLPNDTILTASIVYYSTMEECLENLALHARTCKSHLPGRSVATVGEVKVFYDEVEGPTLAELWPKMFEPG